MDELIAADRDHPGRGYPATRRSGNHVGAGVRSHRAHERSRWEGEARDSPGPENRGGACTSTREKPADASVHTEIGAAAPVGGGSTLRHAVFCNDGYQAQGSERGWRPRTSCRPMRERRRVGLTRFQRDGSCARSRRPITRRAGVPGGVRSHTESRAGYTTPKDG